MFKVNGMQIDVTPLQLLEDLKLSLAQNGIILLHTIKPGNNNIQFSSYIFTKLGHCNQLFS